MIWLSFAELDIDIDGAIVVSGIMVKKPVEDDIHPDFIVGMEAATFPRLCLCDFRVNPFPLMLVGRSQEREVFDDLSTNRVNCRFAVLNGMCFGCSHPDSLVALPKGEAEAILVHLTFVINKGISEIYSFNFQFEVILDASSKNFG